MENTANLPAFGTIDLDHAFQKTGDIDTAWASLDTFWTDKWIDKKELMQKRVVRWHNERNEQMKRDAEFASRFPPKVKE